MIRQVVLDLPGLESSRISLEDRFTKSISGVTLRTALDLIYREMGLTYLISGEAYVITSRSAGARQLTNRTYEVTRFVTDATAGTLVAQLREPRDVSQKVDNLIKLINTTVQPEPPERKHDTGKLLVRIYPITFGLLTAEQGKELLELALAGIDWNEPHFIKVIGQTLVIKQTEHVHLQIVEVLGDLAGLSNDRINR